MQRQAFLAVAALFLATAADAATITNIGGVAQVDATAGVSVSDASFVTSPTIETVSIDRVTLSVYDGTAAYGNEYFNVGRGASAELKLDAVTDSFEFLWGSPDLYNTVTLMLNGSIVATLTGADVPGAVLGSGAVLVRIGDEMFDTILFSSDSPAFEFANIKVAAAVPLPASSLLLLAGLGGLAATRRRKS